MIRIDLLSRHTALFSAYLTALMTIFNSPELVAMRKKTYTITVELHLVELRV